ncbi:aldehyde dehydrogenase family protein [Saccharopolyspora phatthalungensis]|uniref:Succinate-semialdehyde dehydrogenase/glutarate-semialdehyde dehydrogenase n=1 Tax=Saccharopolyspora phatthalungensis TaxID=664693 RepID=A0A840Q8M8_9PSEU|nr:aldehyde dehydrogenase family protein [Saccharopolyspora phatthalungensis]MBB5158882.1 succinate-semialdehyde dehydrogenase/glutarate-semialdehyde dehydrogenase [Saccharopolyspora phatthalungensis]
MTATEATVHTLAGVRINGEPVQPAQPWRTVVTEPATGQDLAQLIGGGKAEAMAALDAAASAERPWAETAVAARAEALRAIAADLRAEPGAEQLAVAISRETGKRIAESRAEVGLSAAFFEWFADAIRSRHGQSHSVVPGLRHEVIQRPLGIVAVLTPWNFPVSIPARKIAPALAAGCPLLFKPSEVAPESALRLAEIVEAHVPAGVLNTVVGDPAEVSGSWLDDPRVRGLTFTGSTRVGQLLAAQTAPNFTRNVLELGGNAPFVVLAEADLRRAAEVLAIAKFRNNGQSCIAAQQVWVPDHLVDSYANAFTEVTDELVLGDPLDPSTTLGPLALPSDPGRVAEVAQDAAASGATVVTGKVNVPANGYFAAPVLCLQPGADSRAVTEEIFGPMAVLRGYRDVDEVITATRTQRYGLGGYVVGDPLRATAVAQALDVGIVGVNNATPNTPLVPFGGLKHSGLGWEGGQAGLDVFLTQHTTAVGA